MTEMYGSYSDEDLNEWERMPQNIRVLTSSAFGAWLLRRDKRIKEQVPKTGHWIKTSNGALCSICKGYAIEEEGLDILTDYCPWCGVKMEEEE